MLACSSTVADLVSDMTIGRYRHGELHAVSWAVQKQGEASGDEPGSRRELAALQSFKFRNGVGGYHQ